MASLFARAARGPSLRHIRRLGPVRSGAAAPRVAAVYAQVEAEFGMLAPPVALHAPAVEVLEAAWLILRETLLAGDPADRAGKEVVAAAVSVTNSCPYCVDVHSAALTGLHGRSDADLIAAGRAAQVADPRLRELALWVQGGPVPGRLTPEQAADLIGVAVAFHYLNRMVNLFLAPSPLSGMPAPGRVLGRLAAPALFGRLARSAVPGRSAIAPGELPADLAWAVPSPRVAHALARGCASIEAAGAQVLSCRVRDLVSRRLDDPTEHGPGLALRPWLDGAVRDLSTGERGAARLALLAGYASDRATDADLGGRPDDQLVRLTAWASLSAARRAGAALGGTR